MEMANRCLETYLRCVTRDLPRNWAPWISLAKFWYNTTNFHITINISLFQELYGIPPPIHLPYVHKDSSVEVVDSLLVDQEATFKCWSSICLKLIIEWKFKLIDIGLNAILRWRIWCIWNCNLIVKALLLAREFPKLVTKYFGPYKIIDKFGKCAYCLTFRNSPSFLCFLANESFIFFSYCFFFCLLQHFLLLYCNL